MSEEGRDRGNEGGAGGMGGEGREGGAGDGSVINLTETPNATN